MNAGSTVFAQLMAHASRFALDRCIRRYDGNRGVRRFSCRDQFLGIAFAQLTYRESRRDIEACLGAIPERLYHMGLQAPPARNTLAVANEKRDWRIYADFAQVLIHEARRLYASEPLGLELEQTVYALDSTTIDRGYLDFERLYRLQQARAVFVTRAKKNLACRRLYSRAVDRTPGLFCDQTVVLTVDASRQSYPEKLRRVRFRDPDTEKAYTFLTHGFVLPALTVAGLYKSRWQVELFFKWIKQHLRIKAFYGRSANAVKTQLWIAISVYVRVAIVKKRLGLERDLYTLLQILSLCLFEKVPLQQVLAGPAYTLESGDIPNQVPLFEL